jgi:putative Ca2+/H+ antiporter (TMEM165/GDT1 family)
MDLKTFLVVFGTVFVAELGDKTQLATLLFAADRDVSKWTVFAGSALALVVAAGMGVLAGGWIAQHVSERHLALIAGTGFLAIGAWTLAQA